VTLYRHKVYIGIM